MWQGLALSGDLKVPAVVRQLAQACDILWAADGGLNRLLALGLEPQHYLGDGDSLNPAGKAFLRKHTPDCQIFPEDKDYTDSNLALLEMLKRADQDPETRHVCPYLPGSSGIIFLAGLGSRWDHVLANMSLARHYCRSDLPFLFTDGASFIWFLEGPFEMVVRLPKPPPDELGKAYYSLIAGSSQVEGLTLNNVRWPLSDYTLRPGASLAISNEQQGSSDVRVAFRKGKLLLMVSYEDKKTAAEQRL